MTDFLTIEPAPELAGPFAVWCLGRDSRVQTVSAGGFLVPLDWYADIPPELLNGAVVDGFRYDHPTPQPEATDGPLTTSKEAGGTERPEQRGEAFTPSAKATVTTARKTTGRKRQPRARKVPEA